MENKKETCHWCGEKKDLLVGCSHFYAIEMGRDPAEAQGNSKVYLADKSKYAERHQEEPEAGKGMCKECWVDSYHKSHPKLEVINVNAKTA